MPAAAFESRNTEILNIADRQLPDATAVAAPSKTARLAVFISYARADIARVDPIVTALEEHGIACIIDTRDLPYGEKWQNELEDFIRAADAVVFFASRASLASTWCGWELAQVASLSKRLVPVLLEPIPPESLPPEVGAVHLFPLFADVDAELRASDLAEVLTTDRQWLKQHTRFGLAAAKWSEQSRPRDLLLRGATLSEAEAWIDSRPDRAPPPSSDVLDFLLASRRAAQTRQRGWLAGSLTVALIASLLAGFAYWQRGIAAANLVEALRSRASLLVDRAAQSIAGEDAVTGLLLSLEALPDAADPERRHLPEVAGADSTLRTAMRAVRERVVVDVGTRPIAVVVDPGGRYAALAATTDLLVYDVATRTELLRIPACPQPPLVPEGAAEPVNAAPNLVNFSPDGGRIAIGCLDRSVRILTLARDDATGGLRIDSHHRLTGHDHFVYDARFSPSGRYLVSTSEDRRAFIWNVRTMRRIGELTGHEGAIRNAAFSPDERLLATASYDGTARLWSLDTMQQEGEPLRGHARRLWWVGFDPAGKRLVTASEDKTAMVWDVKSRRAQAVLRGHTGRVWSAFFSPDGTTIATASDDATARLWDARHGDLVGVLRGHDGDVNDVAFTPDGRELLTVGDDATLRFWAAATPDRFAILDRDHDHVWHGAFSDAARALIATASWDRRIRLWDSRTGAPRGKDFDCGDKPRMVAFDPKAPQLAIACENGHLYLWRYDSEEPPRPLGSRQDDTMAVVFDATGSRLFAGGSEHFVRVFDTRTLDEIVPLRHKPHDDAILSIDIDAVGRSLVTASFDHTARVRPIDRSTDGIILKGHASSVYKASFSPDARRVLTASADGTARIWDAASGQEIASLRLSHRAAVRAASYSPDGRLIVTACDDGVARIWDAQSARELVQLRGHTGRVISAVFGPDGRSLLTTSDDETSRLWQPAADASWSAPEIHAPAGQALVEAAKRLTPRCLTKKQREQASLSAVPPRWCITGPGREAETSRANWQPRWPSSAAAAP